MVYFFETPCCFYHAMRMHSATYAVARCPSIKNILSKSFHNRVATPFCFSMPNSMAIFRWGSSVEYDRGMKNRDFPPIYRCISKTIQDTALVTMECE